MSISAPPIVDDATRRQFLAILGAAGLLGACSGGSTPVAPGPSTRTVTHPLGTTEVPTAPSRIVVLDRRGTLPHLLALGMRPIGALTHRSIIGADFPPAVADQLSGVEVIATGTNADDPKLEAVAALRPDLLLGWTDGIGAIYPKLSAIAPTVGVEIDFGDAAVGLRSVAKALGREPEAAQVIADFDTRLAAAAAGIGPAGDVSVLLSIGNATIRVYSPSGYAITKWLERAGGRIGPDPTSLRGEPYQDLFVAISPENLGAIAAPTVVLLHNTGSGGAAALAELENSPLWSTLPAVRSGRVIRLDSQPVSSQYGFQGYRTALDDLVTQWRALRA